jgi:hypothetical protein
MSTDACNDDLQSEEDILRIVNEAKTSSSSKLPDPYDLDDMDFDLAEGSGEFTGLEYGLEDYTDDRLFL